MNNRPAILSEAGAHAEWIARPLIDAGCTLQHCTMREVPERLATGRFNVLLLGKFYSLRRTKGQEEAAVRALSAAVDEFLAKGGGVFFSLPIEGGVVDFRPFLEPYDVRILKLAIEQDGHTYSENGAEQAYTTNVHPAFAADVEGIWFPLKGHGNSTTTRPVWGDPQSGWFPVLSAMADSRTSTNMVLGHGAVRVDPNQPSFDRAVPLIQARPVGRGRMAVCGIAAGFHVAAPHNYPAGKRFLADGFAGTPSGLRQLLFNLWDWLGEPSRDRLGGAPTEPDVLRPQVPRFPDDPPVRWANRDLPRPTRAPSFGLVGARTAYSSGHGTVAEYVERARANGLDFIVFLEEFTALDAADLEKLKAECREYCTDDFLAIPGYTIDDVSGSHFFQYGPSIVFPEDDLLDPAGERLAAAQNATDRNRRMASVHCRFYFGTLAKGCRRGRFNYGACPVIFEEHRFCDSTGLVTWHDGQLVDDQRGRFGGLVAQGMRTTPTVITLLDCPADVDRVLADGWRLGMTEPYTTMPDKVLRKWMAPELEWWGMIDEQRMLDPAFRLGHHQYGVPFQFITQGPAIHEWTASVTSRDPSWRAPDTEIPPTADPYRVDVIQFVLRIRVTAEDGLDLIVLLDGERPLRRWQGNGQLTFETELDMIHDHQMHLRLEVSDRKGRRAMSSDFTTLRLDWCEFYCADRNNPLTIGFECGPDRQAYGWSGTIYLTYGIGPWGGSSHGSASGRLWRGGDNIYPVPCSPIHDESAPTDGGVRHPAGGLHVFPLVPGEETLMVRCFQQLVSPDIAIDSAVHDRMFDWKWPWFFGRTDTGFGHFPSAPTRYFAMQRTARVFRPVPGLLTTLIYDYDLRWKETPPSADPVVIGWLDEQVGHVLHRRDGTTVELAGLDATPFCTPWHKGEYIVSWEDGDRPAIFYNDGVNLELWRDTESSPVESDGLTNPRGHRLCLRITPGTIPCRLRFIAAGAPAQVAPSDIGPRYCREMGLTGAAKWPVAIRQGSVVHQRVMLELRAENGGVALRWSAITLASGIPVAVHGLNENWCVFLVDRAAGKWRPLGMLNGTAYVSLDPRREADVYLGHPLAADRDDVILNLLQVGDSEWRLEVHNPTDTAVTTTVRPVPEFDLLAWDGATFELQAGTSQTARLSSRSFP